MPLNAAAVLALAASCAPDVAPATLLAIARVESALNPLAIGVNGAGPRPRPAHDRAEAIRTAEALLARRVDLDLGLAQINTRNLDRLGLTVSEAFEPCANLRAAGDVLKAGYRGTSADTHPQARLRIALSVYNTGHPLRGFRNGYVAKVTAAAKVQGLVGSHQPLASAPPASPRWRVFGPAAPGGSFVLSLQPGDRP